MNNGGFPSVAISGDDLPATERIEPWATNPGVDPWATNPGVDPWANRSSRGRRKRGGRRWTRVCAGKGRANFVVDALFEGRDEELERETRQV